MKHLDLSILSILDLKQIVFYGDPNDDTFIHNHRVISNKNIQPWQEFSINFASMYLLTKSTGSIFKQ